MAQALWDVFQLGMPTSNPGYSNGSDTLHHQSNPHVVNLLLLLKEHLVGSATQQNTLWIHRRELCDLLRVLDCGLQRLRTLDEQAAERSTLSVARFLGNLTNSRNAPRKPVNRQRGSERAFAAAG